MVRLTSGPGGGNPDDYEAQRPRIGNIEPITMRCEYQLPWNRQSSQTACGRNIQNQVGDEGWRIVIEGIMSKRQFDDLRSLRDQEMIEVVTEEMGSMRVAFDNLIVTRASEEATGHIEGDYGPLLEFQLQTKEDSEDDSAVVDFSGEDSE